MLRNKSGRESIFSTPIEARRRRASWWSTCLASCGMGCAWLAALTQVADAQPRIPTRRPAVVIGAAEKAVVAEDSPAEDSPAEDSPAEDVADDAPSLNEQEQLKKENTQKYAGGASLKTNPELEELMKRAELFATEQSYRNATLLWQRVLEKSGDSLYTTDGETYYSLAREVERRISKLPVDGMRVYRVGADGETKAILAEAKGPVDEDALSKIVDNYFLSSMGDEAAFDLGCLALDHYDFVGASRLFNKIITEYPEPTVPLDQVYLRLALATAHIGDEKSAREAIAQARKLAAAESAELVEMIAANIEAFAKQSGVVGRSSRNYEMRLGAMNRIGAMPAPPADALATDLTPEWEAQFPVAANDRGEFAVKVGTRKPVEAVADQSSQDAQFGELVKSWKQYHWMATGQLLLSEGRIYFRTGNDITAWSAEGMPEKPLWRSLWLNQFTLDDMTKGIRNFRQAMGQGGNQVANTGRPETLEQVFYFGDRIHQSIMVDAGVVYAIEGKRYSRFESPASTGTANQQQFGFNASVPRRSRTNFLTAYDAQTGKLLWHRPAADVTVKNEPASVPDPSKPAEAQGSEVLQNVDETAFMSAPVAYGNLLLCAVSEGGSIWIYGLDKADRGKTVWKSYLCDEPSGGCDPWSPIEIAVEGRDAYVVCGTGAVFGLDAVSGALRFARRYLRNEKDSPMKINYQQTQAKEPIGWDDDLVIPFGNALVVMASDHDWLFAIDRRSGEFIWRAPRHPLEDDQVAEYCLGVVNNKMYVAGNRVVICYDLAGDGRLNWVTPLEENSYGRGFVSENGVYLPVEDSIVQLDLLSGKQLKRVGVTLPSGEPVGNIYCDGKRLWVMGLNKVYGLTSLQQKMNELDKEVKQGDVGALRERMHLYSKLDRFDEAIQDFQSLLQQAAAHSSQENYQVIFAELTRANLCQLKPARILELLGQHETTLADEARANFHAVAGANKGIVLTALRKLIVSADAARVPLTLQASRLLPELANQQVIAVMLAKIVEPSDVGALQAFISGNPEYSFVALRSLVKQLGAEAKPVISGLLQASSETVRYGAAMELANLGDRGALLPLVALMESSDPLMRGLAARTLGRFTKQNVEFKANGEEQQQAEAVKQWREWVQGAGQTAELRFPLYGDMLLRGRTVVCLPNSQRIVEYDAESEKPVWEHKLAAARACVGLPDGHRLIACFQNRQVVEVDDDEAKVWECGVSDGYPASVQRLENGNTLIGISGGSRHCAIEVDPDKNIIWSCRTPAANNAVMDARRLENGNTLITLTAQQKVMEVDPDGKTVWEANNLNQPYSAQRLENGNTLVAQFAASRVVEIDPEAKIVWQLDDVVQPQSAQRLPDGHTLVGYRDGWKEVDEDKKVVRQQSDGPVTSVHRY